MNSRIVSVISASRTSFTSSHPWKSAPSMASKDAVKLRSLSFVSPTTEANPDVADATVGANKSTVDKDTDPQTLLRNELENFAEGQGRRIALHVDSGANVKQCYDDGTVGVKLTVLHVLFDAFSKSSEDDETKRRSCAESLQTLLDLGAHPTARDHNDRSVLQAAVANLCPVNLLEILLSSDRDVGGDSALLLDLLASGKAFYMDYVENLIGKGTNLELTTEESNSLDLMAGLEDKGKSLISLVEQKRPQLLRKHANSMLQHAVKSGSLETVKFLLKIGATCVVSKMRDLPYDKVTLLADHRVIRMSAKPIEMTLQLAALYRECSKREQLHCRELLSLSDSMQSLAVEMMDKAHWTEDNIGHDLFEYGIEHNQKMFIASVPVQQMVKTSWYGNVRLERRQYAYKVFLFLAKAFFLPFVFAFCLPCLRFSCLRTRYTEWMKVSELVIVYIANTVTYLLFVLLLVLNVSLKSSDIPATSPSNLDWIVLVFVVALALQEVAQAFSHRQKFTHYAKNWSNSLDIVLILTFISYYVLLFVGYYAIDDSFQVIRASFHFLGFASLLSTVRFLWYLQAHSLLGPIQLSFFGIFYDVLLFLVILGTFLIGFAVSLTSVYSAPVKSLGAPENETVPVVVSGMWPSLKMLFWSLFGLIELSSFEAERGVETAVGTGLLALWLVLAVIVLLNMLIALISDAFQKVQDNADMEWKFARAVIIHDIAKSLPIPVPINIFHLIALLVLNVQCSKDCCQPTSNPNKNPADYEEVQRKLREKIAEAEGEEGVQKRDLKKLREHLDKQISVLKAVVQPGVMAMGFTPNLVSEESESEESDDDGLHSFLRRRMMSLPADAKSKQSKTESVSVTDREGNKGSWPKPKVDTVEKSLSGQLKSTGDTSTAPVGATQQESAQELLKGLRQLQKNFEESFQKLQLEFVELQGKAAVSV